MISGASLDWGVKKRYRPGYMDQNEGHILGNVAEWEGRRMLSVVGELDLLSSVFTWLASGLKYITGCVAVV